MSQSGSKQEIEIKLRVPDPAAGERLVLNTGFHVSVPRTFEANTIYDTPDSALRQRGVVLRLRSAGEKFTLTVKGPGSGGKHKSRSEDEVVVSDYQSMHQILVQLGYQSVFRYEKYRTEFISTKEIGTVTLDETPIGTYLELEGPADWIDITAKALNFEEADYVVDSYGKLYEEYCTLNGKVPSNMIFDI
jgi:adenylate cyclase class 2